MSYSLDIQLPNELLPFKKNIEATIKPYVEIKAYVENKLSLWQSKFGGLPYLPKNIQYPKDSKGQFMSLLARINFAEVPGLELFPQSGILQFFISGTDDFYGACLENLANQDGFRVLFFPEVLEGESSLVTDFGFLPKFDRLPFEKSCSLEFGLQYAPLSQGDYQFESSIIGQASFASEDERCNIYDKYAEVFPSTGHKIGGYPYFTQNDPRYYEEYKNKGYTLLFQMDTDYEAGIIWGDAGVANFFILEEDLKKEIFPMFFTIGIAPNFTVVPPIAIDYRSLG